MILGVGTDVISIERITKLYKKFPSAFHKKILSPIELTKYESFTTDSKKIKFLSSRWAAKEALVKACGTGFRNGLYLPKLSIINNTLGRPQIILSDNIQTIINKIFDCHNINIHLTLSDEAFCTLAFVVIEKN